jgi:lipopolysaccharide heptosyltransferase II
MSQADYFFRLAKSVYAELEVEKPKLSIPRSAFLKSESLLPPEKRPAIGVGFGAEYGSAKMWPAERFAELIDRLENMARIVLIGTDSDREIAAKVFALAKSSPLSLVGKTDLPTLVATLKRLALYITNDTGPMHLAAAAGTPVVAIFGPTSPEETRPLGGNHILIYHGADCAPCWKRKCPRDLECMNAVSVDEVEAAVRSALKTAPLA